MEKVLITDIGGTNIRFAIACDGHITNKKQYKSKDFSSVEEAIQNYLKSISFIPKILVIGTAGEVKDGKVELANCPIKVDIKNISKKFEFKKIILANDMVYQAIGAINTSKENWTELNPNYIKGNGLKTSAIVVVGTGFGVAFSNGDSIEASEAGHNNAVPTQNLTDIELFAYMKNKKTGVWEDFISGPSSLHIYQILTKDRADKDKDKLAQTPIEVNQMAHKGDDKALTTYMVMARFMAQFIKQTVATRPLSSFYIGGLGIEILGIPKAQEEFSKTLYSCSNSNICEQLKTLSIRLIKLKSNLALIGLSLVADDIVKNGTTSRISKKDIHFFE